MEYAIVILAVFLVMSVAVNIELYNRYRSYNQALSAMENMNRSHVKDLNTTQEKIRIDLINKHNKKVEELKNEFTSDYRRDALNALAHLAENATKDEVKLEAATQLITSVSPVTFVHNDHLR